jgi:hypothetical protein
MAPEAWPAGAGGERSLRGSSRRAWFALSMVLVPALAACGASGGTTAAPKPTPTATPRGTPHPVTAEPVSPATIIVVGHAPEGSLSFFRADGSVAGTHAFSAETSPSAYATANGRLWYVSPSDHHLHSLTADAVDTDVTPLQDAMGGVFGLAVNPDGTRWAWGVLIGAAGSQRARVDIGGIGVQTTGAIEQSTQGYVLAPLGWTSEGILVARRALGIGGCCYLAPETGARDALLLDPATRQTVSTWTGCATAAVTPAGSFSCVGTSTGTSTVVVHRQQRTDVTLDVLTPVRHVGWAMVDDAGARAVFGVVHSSGAGGSAGPYAIDTEVGDLATSKVSAVASAMTPDAVLPDGRLVVTSAPPVPPLAGFVVSLRSPSGETRQLGTADSFWVADLSTAS